jgi:hypothetical protein
MTDSDRRNITDGLNLRAFRFELAQPDRSQRQGVPVCARGIALFAS